MKFGIRKPSIRKSLAARNPVTQAKRKYSVKKYTDPVGTAKKRVYNKVYSRTTISLWNILKKMFKGEYKIYGGDIV